MKNEIRENINFKDMDYSCNNRHYKKGKSLKAKNEKKKEWGCV